jgi:hypothetical protein
MYVRQIGSVEIGVKTQLLHILCDIILAPKSPPHTSISLKFAM